MKIYHLERRQKLPITQDVAWAFFSNPANLAQLTPPDAAMEDESFERPKRIYAGMIQIFRVKLLGGLLSSRWVAEITHVEAPNAFVDEQKIGPFAFWHHRHSIIAVPGGVEIVDSAHYAMPGWVFGGLIHWLMVKKQLERLFQYRQKMLVEFFGEW